MLYIIVASQSAIPNAAQTAHRRAPRRLILVTPLKRAVLAVSGGLGRLAGYQPCGLGPRQGPAFGIRGQRKPIGWADFALGQNVGQFAKLSKATGQFSKSPYMFAPKFERTLIGSVVRLALQQRAPG
jgi:hypothetical protein